MTAQTCLKKMKLAEKNNRMKIAKNDQTEPTNPGNGGSVVATLDAVSAQS